MVSRGKYDMPCAAARERLLLETYDLTLPPCAAALIIRLVKSADRYSTCTSQQC